MNPYERFTSILRGEKPDKIPFYFPTIDCSVASEILGRKVYSGGESLHFHEELSWIDGDAAHEEFVFKYREAAIELNKVLRADVVRETWRSSRKPSMKLDEYTLLFGKEDGSHTIKRFFPESQTYGIIEDTTGPKDVDELLEQLSFEMKNSQELTEDELYNIYRGQVKFKEMAEPYFPTIVGGPGFGIPMYDVVWLEAAALEPKALGEYFLYIAEIGAKHIKWLYKQGFRFINGGKDLASNTGPVYSPQIFKKAIVPALKLITDECKKYGMVYCYCTDGNIWDIRDLMFKEAGVQAYGEVDRYASMTVGRLRELYPEVIILGNVSSATLHNGSEEEVREETKATLAESKGRNYIAGPSNAIMHGTPVRNIFAMVEEIEKYKP